jgi:hypothetical protein
MGVGLCGGILGSLDFELKMGVGSEKMTRKRKK